MKTLKVTEVATYEFEVPDDFPARTGRAEEFFCDLSNPRGDAEQLTVTERYFAMEDGDGNAIEMDTAEPDGAEIVWADHTPGASKLEALGETYIDLKN